MTEQLGDDYGRYLDHIAAQRHDPDACEFCRGEVEPIRRSLYDTLSKIRARYGSTMRTADVVSLDLLLSIHRPPVAPTLTPED